MTNITEPKSVDAQVKPEAGVKTNQPEVKPDQPDAEGKPKLADTGDKSKPPPDGTEKKEEAAGKYNLRKIGKISAYVLLGIAAIFLLKYEFFTPPEVVVAQVLQQDFTGEVQGTGTVNVDVLATVGAKIPGRVERMLVNEGDFVRSGQVVATLEDTDLRQALQRSEARVDSARMSEQAARAMEQSARAGVISVRATAQSRQATKYQTERAWEREKHLVATGAVSQEEADQYEERDRTAGSAVGSADAEIGVALAQVEAAGARVQVAQSEIAASQAEVRLQRFNLSQSKVFTYVNGVVTDRPKRSGDAIVPGETVLTVADPKVILVEAYLDQRFAGDIRAGQMATVIIRGKPKEQIMGRVYRIRPQADPAAEEMTVEIAFPLPANQLQIGQWADVYVQVSRTKDAIVVPKTAVMTMGDGPYVLVADSDNKVRRVNVETRASSPRSRVMAVAADLKPGEWVLTQPMGISAGKKVRPTQSTGVDAAAKGTNPAMKM